MRWFRKDRGNEREEDVGSFSRCFCQCVGEEVGQVLVVVGNLVVVVAVFVPNPLI